MRPHKCALVIRTLRTFRNKQARTNKQASTKHPHIGDIYLYLPTCCNKNSNGEPHVSDNTKHLSLKLCQNMKFSLYSKDLSITIKVHDVITIT